VIEYLPSQHETPSSKPSAAKIKKFLKRKGKTFLPVKLAGAFVLLSGHVFKDLTGQLLKAICKGKH
jgi:hypothetical protein